MAEERRQFVFLSYSFFFFFSLADPRPCSLRDLFGWNSQILENVIQNAALVIRKNVEYIAALNNPTALRSRTVHRPLEELGRLRRYAKSLPGVLPSAIETFFDQ
jgi:hypothetical protein